MSRDYPVPSAPLNLTSVRVADSLVKLKWEEPESPNGILKGYSVYILNQATNITDIKKVINPQRIMEFTANNLSELILIRFSSTCANLFIRMIPQNHSPATRFG